MKKAQGFSLKLIIVAVISLVVLIIMISMFTGELKIFGENIKDCSSKGGICVELGECESYRLLSAASCNEGDIKRECCMEDML